MWIYKDTLITSHDDLHPSCTNIVYIIRYKDGMKYIGQKKVRTTVELQLLKNGKKRGSHLQYVNRNKNGKRVKMEVCYVNKPFVDYIGSSDENIGKEILDKEIINQCSNGRTATYLEAKYLFKVNAIESNDVYTNKNILGSFYDNCLEGLIDG